MVTGPDAELSVPVTARLSQKFYERFGDDLTNELVDWMNQVDAGYRTELRELSELNFGRFDARVQHGLDELRAEFRESLSQVHDEIGAVRESLMEMKGELRSTIEASRAEAMKWNIIMWVGAVGTMVALVKL